MIREARGDSPHPRQCGPWSRGVDTSRSGRPACGALTASQMETEPARHSPRSVCAGSIARPIARPISRRQASGLLEIYLHSLIGGIRQDLKDIDSVHREDRRWLARVLKPGARRRGCVACIDETSPCSSCVYSESAVGDGAALAIIFFNRRLNQGEIDEYCCNCKRPAGE